MAESTSAARSELEALIAELEIEARSDAETRPVTRRHEVPASAENFTVDWLTDVLCADVPDARVLSFTLRGAASTHTQRRAIELDYNAAGEQAGLPRRLFSKSTPFGGRAIVRISGATGNEIGFFNQIDRRTGLETPHAFHAAYDHRSMRSMILMEDADARGATFLDVSDPWTVDMVKGVLAELAILHARWWESPDLDAPFDWLKPSSQFNGDLDDILDFERVSMIGVDAAADILPAAITGDKPGLWAAFKHSLALSDRAPRTLLHGDIHPGNTYTLPNGRMGLCDWQCTVKGVWARDVAYVITSFLPADQRPLVERDLLAFYLDRLRAGNAPAPNFDDAWRLYRLQTLHAFMSWAFTYGMALTQIEMQPPQICREMLRRMGTAIDQLDTLAALAEAD